MRLPQSILAPFSSRVCSIIAVACFPTVSLCVGAAAQQLTCAPSTLLFGSVVIGQSESEIVSVSNGGPTSVTVSALKTSGTGFNLSGLTLPLTLAAGQSVPFEVTFSPTI